MSLVWPLVIFGVIFGAGWLVRRLILRALRAWSARTQSRAGAHPGRGLKGPALIWTGSLELTWPYRRPNCRQAYGSQCGSPVRVVDGVPDPGRHAAGRKAGSPLRGEVPGALPVTTLSQNLVQIGVGFSGWS